MIPFKLHAHPEKENTYIGHLLLTFTFDKIAGAPRPPHLPPGGRAGCGGVGTNL